MSCSKFNAVTYIVCGMLTLFYNCGYVCRKGASVHVGQEQSRDSRGPAYDPQVVPAAWREQELPGRPDTVRVVRVLAYPRRHRSAG